MARDIDYGATNTDLVRVASYMPENDRTLFVDRYTVYTKDENGDYSEEIDLDVQKGTPSATIRSAAQFVLDNHYESGLTIYQIKRQFGLYL